MRFEGFLVLALATLASCRTCRDTDRAADGASAQDAPAPTKLAEPLRFEALPSPQGFGLPSGCHLDPPIQRAELPRGSVRFLAARATLDDLALAVGEADGSAATASAWLALAQRRAEPIPWSAIDDPPALARSESGLLVAHDSPVAGGVRAVRISHSGKAEEKLAEGDQLWVADVACDGARCAVLTGLARKAAAPGATLFIGDAHAAAATWKRIDIEADPAAPWKPYGIVAFEGATRAAWVALALKKKIALWRIENGRAELRSTLDTPHGVYDVVLASAPLVIAPGAPANQPCERDEFPISVMPMGAEPFTVMTQAAPDSVIARPLGSGALVMWVGPVSCRMTKRIVVHAALLAKDGKPSGSAMSIADASGFAVATRGDAVSAWLHTRQTITWLRAHCTPQ